MIDFFDELMKAATSDRAVALSTLGAALLAAISIIYSGKQARKAEQALLRERRIDFELGLLVEVSHYINGNLEGYLWAFEGYDNRNPELRRLYTLARAKRPDASIDFRGDPDVYDEVNAEIQHAIEKRLSERGDPSGSSAWRPASSSTPMAR